jgi:hypothetical protein
MRISASTAECLVASTLANQSISLREDSPDPQIVQLLHGQELGRTNVRHRLVLVLDLAEPTPHHQPLNIASMKAQDDPPLQC